MNHQFQHIAQPLLRILPHFSIPNHLLLTPFSRLDIKNHLPQTEHIPRHRARRLLPSFLRRHKLPFKAPIVQHSLHRSHPDVRQPRHQRARQQHVRRTDASVSDRRVLVMQKPDRSRDLQQPADLRRERQREVSLLGVAHGVLERSGTELHDQRGGLEGLELHAVELPISREDCERPGECWDGAGSTTPRRAAANHSECPALSGCLGWTSPPPARRARPIRTASRSAADSERILFESTSQTRRERTSCGEI